MRDFTLINIIEPFNEHKAVVIITIWAVLGLIVELCVIIAETTKSASGAVRHGTNTLTRAHAGNLLGGGFRKIAKSCEASLY